MMRKSKGRQKLEMVKLSNESNLKVTFCKRRSGLFKKASELCILCDAKVAIIVFSPKKKVYSFGHPCVESVMNQFITRNAPQSYGALQCLEDYHNFNAHELSIQLTQVLNELEAEEKRGEELSQMRKASQSQYWWEAPVDKLNPPQLEHLKLKLEDLTKNIARQTEKIMIQSSTVPQEFPDSSSTGTSVAFDPTNTLFNDPTTNMIPPPPPTYQPHQPLPFNSPPYHTHPLLHPDPRFSFRFD